MKLREFLDLYNFREVNEDITNGAFEHDTQLIRINFGAWSCNFVEFGIADWSDNKQPLYSAFINPDVLDSDVECIRFERDINEVVVTICYPMEM